VIRNSYVQFYQMYLVGVHKDGVSIWDEPSKQLLASLKPHGMSQRNDHVLCVSRDGQRLVMAKPGDTKVVVWDISNIFRGPKVMYELGPFDCRRSIVLCFSKDSEFL
jgi:WD40 repeat protein